MGGQRDEFSRWFANEGLLQQAVSGLLSRMPENSRVQILQGPQEYGKDIIFYTKGGFGEQILCACVVKNTAVTGTVGSGRGARTVFLQAEQAFDTPHVDESGNDVRVSRVYIVTTFPMRPETIHSIDGKLKERAGQISFIDGPILLKLFREYWPDYIADEFGQLQTRLEIASRKISHEHALTGVTFQYQLGKMDRSIKSFYVQPRFHRDLRVWRLTQVVDRIPHERRQFKEGLTVSQVASAISQVQRLNQLFPLLRKWGFYDEDLVASAQRSLAAFDNALTKELNDPDNDTFRTSLDKRRVNEDWLLLPKLSMAGLGRRVKESVPLALNGLTTVLEECASFIESPMGNFSRLRSSAYLATSKIDDLCDSAPFGFLEYKATVQMTFTPGFLESWDSSILIVAPAGYGKTSFCRWHALNDIDRLSQHLSDVLPVYLPLHQFSTSQIDSFRQMYEPYVGQSALLTAEKHAKRSQQSQRLRVYLDGLDEIPHEERRRHIMLLVQDAVDRDHTLQVIVTARDYIRGDYMDWIPKIIISKFDEGEVAELVAKWLDDPNEGRLFFGELERVPQLKQVMQTPLLATLVILVFRQTRRFPESRTRLYEMFVDLLSGGWDLAKGVQRASRFGSSVKIMILKRLAGMLHAERRREFSSQDLDFILKRFSSALSESSVDFRNELTQDGLVVVTGRHFEFSHLSIQEYLAARDLLGDPTDLRVDDILEQFLLGDDWWSELLSFYFGLSGKPREIKKWVQTTAKSLLRANPVGTINSRSGVLLERISAAFPLMDVTLS